MNGKLKEKTREALSSVLPITLIVLALSVTVTPMPIGTLLLFLTGACLAILGMGLFSLGADLSMMPMGEGVGAQLTRSRKVWLAVLVSFVMGVLITIAEPDLTVLANQIPSIPNPVLIGTVAAGVGVFLVIAVLRTLFRVKLPTLLLACYAVVFVLSIFSPNAFVPMAFDSGGVTTGPITVPFIMSLGVGLAAMRSDKNTQEDSFGLVALCSVGPILAVLILGICYNPSSANYEPVTIPTLFTTRDVAAEFAHGIPDYLKEVLLALLPILAFFLVFQLAFRRFTRPQIGKMGVGFLYTLAGLALFLTGANIGFMPAGYFLGTELVESGRPWVLIPLGMVIGYFIVAAEPAVHVLNKQVEEVSDGAISQKAMQRSLSIGVALSLGLSMLRVLTGISIYWIVIPGYALALLLTFFAPPIFTGIAFDSGGVASGPMTAAFLLPFAMGACAAVGGDILTDAFGVVALVAMTPLITIQLLGVFSHRKRARTVRPVDLEAADDQIIDYEEEALHGEESVAGGKVAGVDR